MSAKNPSHNLQYPLFNSITFPMDSNSSNSNNKYPSAGELTTALHSYEYLQNLSPRYINSLSSYFLLYHSADWLLRTIEPIHNTLLHKGIQYQIAYYGILTLAKLTNTNSNILQIACSYRVPNRQYFPTVSPVVLLSLPRAERAYKHLDGINNS